MKKILGRVLAAAAAALGFLFAVFYYNLDMKLMYYVVVPLMDKYHNTRKAEHYL